MDSINEPVLDDDETFTEDENISLKEGLEIVEHENSFIASILSETCYAASEWVFEPDEPKGYRIGSETILKRDADLIAKSLWVKKQHQTSFKYGQDKKRNKFAKKRSFERWNILHVRQRAMESRGVRGSHSTNT